jgi:hypothetical protein
VIAARCTRAAGGLRDRQDRPSRRDPACTFRPLRDRAVTGVTGVIAVIAGIVSSGPVRAARTVAKGARAVSPVAAVSAGRLRRDLRAGRDRRDSSRSSRSHDVHCRGHHWRSDRAVTSVPAVIAVTLPVLHPRTVGTGPPSDRRRNCRERRECRDSVA